MSGSSGATIGVLISILTFLTLLGIFAPAIQSATGYAVTSLGDKNVSTILVPGTNFSVSSAGADLPVPTSAWGVTGNILTAFFWVFTWMPAWMIALHIVIRIVLAVIIYLLLTELIP